MKNFITLVLTGIILSSCGNDAVQSAADVVATNDITAIREFKTTLTEQQKAVEAELDLIENAIAKLDNKAKLPLVTTITANAAPFIHYLELQGDVKTKQNVLIYPEMPGTLQKIYVTEGQRVSKGQLLASIDDGGLSNQLAQLKTQAVLAKTTFERQERLWNQKIGSEIQYLQSKTNYEASESAVKQLQSQLGKADIRAPFSGIIDDVIKEQGTVVAPGMGAEIFRIVNLSDMYVEVEVPEKYVGSVTPGKEALVDFPVLGESIATKVRQTGNFINPNNRSFKVEIAVMNKNGSIKPNLMAKVAINDYSKDAAVLIPQSIISENAEGEQYIYITTVPDENKQAVASKRIITTGKTQGDLVEILSGLTNGEHVVQEGARSVKDGQTVEIKN